MAQYPIDELRPLNGHISAMIFSNDFTGLAENLFWSVHFNFEPLEFEGQLDQTSLTAEWFVAPIRDWRDLENRVIEGEQETIEGSFHIFEHDLASWTKVAFGNRNGYNFEVSVNMQVELLGLDDSWVGPGPSSQDAAIYVQLSLPYQGFIIERGVLEGSPQNVGQALDIASRYVDLRYYKDARIDYGAFVFEPQDS